MGDDCLNIFSTPTAEWFRRVFGAPTRVQEETWPAIAAGKPVLVSAPTGTGKTLSAFLIFIDRLKALAARGELRQELYLIYVSPLKSLAGDIRENLNRPLYGIPEAGLSDGGESQVRVAVRTGDTPQKERQRMIKRPPHILIITPESLYLMLSSVSGRGILRTAGAVIIDELHALIDTKRGAHLMLSVARLDGLCGRRLQRIGLSATIEPLRLAAEYLSPEPAVICAPSMRKKVRIEVVGTIPAGGRRKDPVWEELGAAVYRRCQPYKSVIAFSEGRRYAEKLAYYVNELGGDGFARVHHGSLSKEQRGEVERDLRDGRLRLLCATSSMELGIDVGDVELVVQVGCPRTISSTMQRLGRAGHSPGRVSVMYMYPRTASESVYCGMTAKIAALGGVEHANPPRLCLDVLAQHLVSMAAGEGYSVDGAVEMLGRAYPFREVTREDVKKVLGMLAGDYEHHRELPVRPRIIYDRIHERVSGDSYSRLLAVTAGGTIPDKGLYAVKTEDGVKLGELDEEFVYESRIGDKFTLGSFGWQILRQDRDNVIVSPAPAQGARLPFWKGETGGRSLRTGMAFGGILRELERAAWDGRLAEALKGLGLDEAAAINAAEFLERQLAATGGLPTDTTVIVEHYRDSAGSCQVMVHSLFGRRVNAPLSLLIQHAARSITGLDIGCVDEEEGFMLYPYGKESLPDGLLFQADPERARAVLEKVLPVTPLFGMTFRYNAARSLMTGMRQGGRQPLWMQRLRSAEMLDSLMNEEDHPLLRETTRECLEDHWDIEGTVRVLRDIRAGLIAVRELHVDAPSPMSIPFQWQTEAEEMYRYSPTTPGVRQKVYGELNKEDKTGFSGIMDPAGLVNPAGIMNPAEMIKPAAEELEKGWERRKLPENEEELHSLLMMEGDLAAGELSVPVEWLESLAEKELALYLEPGLWIAAEHGEEYGQALEQGTEEARVHIVRRLLYYRGGHTAGEIGERYFIKEAAVMSILDGLCASGDIVEDGGVYYHGRLYKQARERSIRRQRAETATQPPEHYAALMAREATAHAPGEEWLREAVGRYCGRDFPVSFWEQVLFPRRVRGYTENMLDRLLTQGDYFWRMTPAGELCFCRYEDIDWDAPLPETGEALEGDELLLYRELQKRGASFLRSLTGIPEKESVQDILLRLAEKGLVCADSFVPVRQWLNREKVKKAAPRQRVNARVLLLSAGRWDIVRPVRPKSREEWLELFFDENRVLCRETFRKAARQCRNSPYAGEDGGCGDWKEALELLRIWEYTGRIRRGYFVAGMSGAQFIRREEYEAVTAALRTPECSTVWLNATDPAQLWGKALETPEGCSFLNVQGTVAALHEGKPAAVLERQGKVLRVLDRDSMETVLEEFVRDFKAKSLFPEKKRLILKEYPDCEGKELRSALERAGFMREMRDFVLYR